MGAYTSTLTLDRSVVKQNDTFPPIVVTVADDNGAMDLTAATSLILILKGQKQQVLITAALSAENMHAGAALYTPQDEDLATSDTYQAELAIVWATGQRQTVPNDPKLNPTLTVGAQLAPNANQ